MFAGNRSEGFAVYSTASGALAPDSLVEARNTFDASTILPNVIPADPVSGPRTGRVVHQVEIVGQGTESGLDSVLGSLR